MVRFLLDPHPGRRIAAGTGAIQTAAPGLQLAQGLEHLAEEMQSVAIVRSLVSKEGDHQRGTHLARTGYRPEPAIHIRRPPLATRRASNRLCGGHMLAHAGGRDPGPAKRPPA